MRHVLGPAGYAAAIHHLITDCLTSRLGQPPPRLRAVLDAALHQLRIVAGEDYDPEQYPGDGLLDARLAHPLNEGGKVAEASIVVDSVRLPDHRPRLHDLWRYAQEAADAPVTAVVSLLRDMGANEAADEVLKGRKAATPLIAQAEEPGDDE